MCLSELMWMWGEGALASLSSASAVYGPPPFLALRSRWWWTRWVGPHSGWDATFWEACLCSRILSCLSQHPPFHPSSPAKSLGGLRVTLGTGRSVEEMGLWSDWWGLQASGSTAHPGSSSRAPTLTPEELTQRVGALQRSDGGPPRALCVPTPLLCYRLGCSRP